MSHFAVLVIGDNPEEQLVPFNEDLDVPRYIKYTKQQLIEKGKKEIENYKKGTYAEYLEDPKKYLDNCSKEHGDYVSKEFPEKFKWTDDQIYKDEVKWYEKEDIGKDGEVYSEYNPNSKWDWYEIGGRWAGSLKLKAGVDKSKYPDLNFSHGWDKEESEKVAKTAVVDQAKFGDLDFSADKESYDESIRFWELYIDGETPKNDKEKKILGSVYYKKEYYTERYDSKEEYARLRSEFKTFAILKDGKWYEKGEMGWFGMDSSTAKESTKWDKSFFDTWIKDLPDDTLLTIVDCHI